MWLQFYTTVDSILLDRTSKRATGYGAKFLVLAHGSTCRQGPKQSRKRWDPTRPILSGALEPELRILVFCSGSLWPRIGPRTIRPPLVYGLGTASAHEQLEKNYIKGKTGPWMLEGYRKVAQNHGLRGHMGATKWTY